MFQSAHPVKGDTAILHKNLSSYSYSIAKNSFVSLSAASEILKIPTTNSKNNSYSGANPLQFSCELPVRTRMAFAIHSHLLHSYHITSFINDTFTIPKNHDPIFFAHKAKQSADHNKVLIVYSIMITGVYPQAGKVVQGQ